jgi:cell shape-determining protein MreC
MFYLILKWTLISLILIVLVHYLYSFFKTTLTVPKIKDLVNRPAGAYKEIYETIEKVKVNEREKLKENNTNNKNNTSNNTLIKNEDNMKDELKSFLNSLSSSDTNKGNGDINSFDYGGSSFSLF